MDARVERIFRDVLEDRNIVLSEETSPENTPSWDSFAQVKLMLALEEEFGVTFSVDDLAGVSNAGDLIAALRAHGVELS